MIERSQRTGDAVHEIIRDYSGMVYRLAYARCQNRADADDIYQDVFFKFFSTKPHLENEEHLKAWLIRATVHASINLIKSAWRRRFQPMPEGYDVPDSAINDDDRFSKLRSAIARLSQKQRIIIHLYYYENYSTEKIAGILGEKSTTIRSHMRRGREKLKSLLTETEVK